MIWLENLDDFKKWFEMGEKLFNNLRGGTQKRNLFILKPALRMFGALCFGNYDSWRESDTKR